MDKEARKYISIHLTKPKTRSLSALETGIESNCWANVERFIYIYIDPWVTLTPRHLAKTALHH